MNDTFLHLADIYLTPGGKLRNGAATTFLGTLLQENIKEFSERAIGKWLEQLYGSNMKWQFIEKTPISGVSSDYVVELIGVEGTYFCKVFVDAERAIREYLASIYITALDIPQWTHVPIVKMGKLVDQNGKEYVYFFTKKAKGMKPFECFQRLSHPNLDLSLNESLFTMLGQILASLHKKETYTFSESEVYTRTHSYLEFLLEKVPSDLMSELVKEPIYIEFEMAAKEFLKSHRTGHLQLGDLNFANFSYSLNNQNIEVFDQGLLINFFTGGRKCYHFAEAEMAMVLFGPPLLSHLLGISQEVVLHLQKTFLRAYYEDRFPPIDDFYAKIDIWIKKNFALALFIPIISKTSGEWIDAVKKEAALYRDNPKGYLARWFPDGK